MVYKIKVETDILQLGIAAIALLFSVKAEVTSRCYEVT